MTSKRPEWVKPDGETYTQAEVTSLLERVIDKIPTGVYQELDSQEWHGLQDIKSQLRDEFIN